MRIRGAGEILGDKQHGALETFGYNLYMKMLQEEIEKQKGTYEQEDNFEDIDVKVDYLAFIPDEYIDKNQKIKVYRDIVEINSLEELDNYRKELIDIYGKMPPEAMGLFEYIRIKFRARELGVCSAQEDNERCSIKFDREKVDVEVIFKLIQEGKIIYKNKEEIIVYNGSIEEFFNLYESMKGEKK